MWLVIVLVLCAAVAAFLILRRKTPEIPPQDVYVCDVCGESECTCRKEEETP